MKRRQIVIVSASFLILLLSVIVGAGFLIRMFPPERYPHERAFKKMMAKDTSCSEERNALYWIDQRYILWAKQGNCPDANISYTLYDRIPENAVCHAGEDLNGYYYKCRDDSLQIMFETVAHHLDDPNLGLKEIAVQWL